jgi:hypothetical protein
MAIAMDNASNCDSTAEEFALLAPTDWHKTWRVRCLLHIINLMAKVCDCQVFFDRHLRG